MPIPLQSSLVMIDLHRASTYFFRLWQRFFTLASASRFGSERMIRAQMGLLVGRPSLEVCLTADGDGEDVGMSVSLGKIRTRFFFQFFFRMLTLIHWNRSTYTAPISHMGGRSRPGTCTLTCAGDTTTPLLCQTVPPFSAVRRVASTSTLSISISQESTLSLALLGVGTPHP